MIPKKINYIWLGGKEKSKLANMCIMSWYDKLCDYEIIEWNDNNLNLDELCESNMFLKTCREKKLWAFMADYLRLYILYNYGGIYFDVDVQVLKTFDDLLENEVFIGYEYFSKKTDDYVTHGTGIIAAEPYNPIIKKCMDFYDNKIWETDVYFIPTIVSIVFNNETENNFKIYPVEYFAPYDYRKTFHKKCITDHTYCIHWFESSWGENKNIGQFLEVKHISNPIKRKAKQIKNLLGYYKRKTKKIIKLCFK